MVPLPLLQEKRRNEKTTQDEEDVDRDDTTPGPGESAVVHQDAKDRHCP
jgi:hypothetical protein